MINVKHESPLHKNLDLPMKKLARTGLIVKRQNKITEQALNDHNKLKALALYVKNDDEIESPINLKPVLPEIKTENQTIFGRFQITKRFEQFVNVLDNDPSLQPEVSVALPFSKRDSSLRKSALRLKVLK